MLHQPSRRSHSILPVNTSQVGRPSCRPPPTNTRTTMLPDVVPPTCVALLLSPRDRAGPIREHQDRPICPPPQSHCSPLTRRPLFSVQVSSRRIARCARALCFWPSIRFVRPGFGVVDMQFLRHGPSAQHRVRVRASAHVCGGGDLRILWLPSVFRDPVLSAHPEVFFPSCQ